MLTSMLNAILESFLGSLYKGQKFHSAQDLPHGMKHNAKHFDFTFSSNVEWY